MGKDKYAYCIICQKQLRKPKGKRCPDCKTKLEYYESPDQFPGAIHPIMHMQKKIKSQKKKKQEVKNDNLEAKSVIFKTELDDAHLLCEFCNEIIDKDSKVCPFCGVPIKE